MDIPITIQEFNDILINDGFICDYDNMGYIDLIFIVENNNNPVINGGIGSNELKQLIEECDFRFMAVPMLIVFKDEESEMYHQNLLIFEKRSINNGQIKYWYIERFEPFGSAQSIPGYRNKTKEIDNILLTQYINNYYPHIWESNQLEMQKFDQTYCQGIAYQYAKYRRDNTDILPNIARENIAKIFYCDI